MTDIVSPEGLDWQGEGGTSLRLEDGHVSGSGGINRLMGSYELHGDRLDFGPLATTMMAGPPELMAGERRFLDSLERVAGWSWLPASGAGAPARLALRDAGGAELLTFERVPGHDIG